MEIQNSKFKIQKNLLVIIFLVFLFLALIPYPAQAICEGPLVPCGPGTAKTQCEFCDIFKLINKIISLILTCLTPIFAVLMLIIGGFYLLIAGGSPELFSKAKSIITAAVIGLVIIFVAWVFLNTFLDAIGVAEWTGLKTWWQIECP